MYGLRDPTKSLALDVPTVSEPRLMSLVGRVRQLCACRSVCFCNQW